MPDMDHTPVDDLLAELEETDPAEAAEPADAIASALSEQLEAEDGEEPETTS